MKKLFIFLALIAFTIPCQAWNRLGHSTIAQIAQNHLTKRAKKNIDKILDGKSIVYVSSFADDYKNDATLDLGFTPINGKRITTYPHTFEANDDCTPYRGIEKEGMAIKNCIYFIDKFAKELRDNVEMTDSARFWHIALIVHFVGDMHCPEHIRYPEDQTIGYYKVRYHGAEVRYHTLWDGTVISERRPWSFNDLATLLDTYSADKIKEVTSGDVWDWGYDSAKTSRPIHLIKEGDNLSKNFVLKHLPLTESQLQKAGYRLAKVLNDIFK